MDPTGRDGLEEGEHLPRPARSRGRGVRRLAAAALAVGAAAGGLGVWRHREAELGATRARLASVSGDLRTTRAGLRADVHRLARAQERLAETERTLASRTAARDDAERVLLHATGELEETRGSLERRREELRGRARRLVALDACLRGAASALNQVAVEDLAGFAATLERVEGACAAARETT